MMRRKLAVVATVLVLVILFAVLAGLNSKANLSITFIKGSGGMPPGYSNGSLFTEEVQVVLTEPFKSLDSFEQSRVIETATTTNGRIKLAVKPGKYGLYFVINGSKVLYDRLDLTPYDIQANPGPRAERGDWYINVGPNGTSITYDVAPLPS